MGIPVALLGAMLGCYVMGTPVSIYTQIGIILLVALSAKNGILIVEFARDFRAPVSYTHLDVYKRQIHQFNQTVLTAVQETDNAMNGYRNSIKQIVALREVCNQGEEALKLSLDLYKQGLTPFQNVLDALRSLLAYQNQLTQAQGNSLQELISLYKALGGGYGNIISGL